MKTGVLITTAAVTMLFGAAAYAECNISYTAKIGDTLTSIAQNEYGDDSKWALVYYSNQKKISGSDLKVNAGTSLHIPCTFKEVKYTSAPLRADIADMKLLTGGNYAPFTDPSWPGQGLITELLSAAMEDTPSPVTYSITWEDDWSKHMYPMLDSKEFDMGFPWFRPDCDKNPDNTICESFHFSEPLMTLPLMLYVRNDSPITLESEDNILGKTLCRPKGFTTYDLDRDGREWLKKGLVTLVKAQTPAACFEMLMKDEVDGVTFNAFLGTMTLNEMGLTKEVKTLGTPLSLQSLHVVISKKHWRGTSHLYRINSGIAALKKSGRYSEIVSRQLSIFQNSLKW